MKERVFNLFLYVDRDLVSELGIAVHEVDGTDDEKISFLQTRVNQDYRTAQRTKVRPPFEWQEYQARERLGKHVEIFEELYRAFDAPVSPLTVITPIRDGLPAIDAITGMGPLDLTEFQDTPLCGQGVMVDYLQAYVSDGRLDIPRLINDDYFLAIKLLFKKGYYVSSAKLLLSFIDTVAFIETGDSRGNFKPWLKKYANLAALGVNEDELWELRNGLLHMTNLDAHKVRAGKISRLIIRVGDMPGEVAPEPGAVKYLNLKGLINVVVIALEKWIESYNLDAPKFVDFVSRYDRIISDTRVAVIRLDSKK